MLLRKIITHKEREIFELKRNRPVAKLKNMILGERGRRAGLFLNSLRGNRENARLICEMKKASPSEGLMKKTYLPRKIAASFDRAGASAISVLTDAKYFQGSIHTIRRIKAVTKLPVLRKDFLIDEYQIYESAAYGADAVLLIVSILADRKLRRLLELAGSLGLSTLVEVHSEIETKRALDAGANLIGINNRNLDTLRISLGHAEKIIKRIPSRITAVVESGIQSRRDVERYLNLGIRAFLIGTALMKAPNIESKIRELLGHGRA